MWPNVWGRPLFPSRQARQWAESQKTRESSIFSPHYPTPPANTIGGDGLFPEKYSHFGDWAVPFGGGRRSKWRQCAAGPRLELKGRRLSRANPGQLRTVTAKWPFSFSATPSIYGFVNPNARIIPTTPTPIQNKLRTE